MVLKVVPAIVANVFRRLGGLLNHRMQYEEDSEEDLRYVLRLKRTITKLV